MNYTLGESIEKMKQMSDKMGSDYFTTPVLLNFFQTACYDFVGKKLKHIEKTQEITDDIRTLIIPVDVPMIEDPNASGKYIAALPSNYLRRVACDIVFDDGTTSRRVDLKSHAENSVAKNSPFRSGTKSYPRMTQYDTYFQFDVGANVPVTMKMTYCKKPSFATLGQPTVRIVNLPDDSIEEIMKTTVTSLFNKTADQRQQSALYLEEAFQKASK